MHPCMQGSSVHWGTHALRSCVNDGDIGEFRVVGALVDVPLVDKDKGMCPVLQGNHNIKITGLTVWPLHFTAVLSGLALYLQIGCIGPGACGCIVLCSH